MGQKEAIAKAFREVKANPPKTLKQQSPDKMRRQKIAIALSKAGASNGN